MLDAPGHPGRYPGLLVEWRRTAGEGWEGRVVYAMPDRPAARLVERWVSAVHLLADLADHAGA